MLAYVAAFWIFASNALLIRVVWQNLSCELIDKSYFEDFENAVAYRLQSEW